MKRKNHDGTLYYDKKKKLYVAMVMIDNKRKSFYGKTEKEAYIKMINYDNRVGMTFGKWCLTWIKTYKINDYKAGTYDKEIRRCNNILKGCKFAKMPITEIKSIHIQNYINELSDRLSPKTIKNYMTIINGAFKQAVNDNIIQINPCKSITMPKYQKADMIALNRFERDLFMDFTKDNPYHDIFAFALNTGMRISEICGLTKDCIDFNKELIIVKQQLVRIKGKTFLDTPKTQNSNRCIPINNTTYEILKNNILSSKNDFVFCNPYTKGKLYQNTLSRNARSCFDKCYEKTKKEVYLKANFHTFRHTFATQWIIQGGNLTLLSKVLGHTDTSFTTRVYVQPSYDDLKNEMSNLVF